MEKQISKHSFQVPDGYFDHVADEILAKIDFGAAAEIRDLGGSVVKPHESSLPVRRRLFRVWAVAASFLAAIFTLGIYLAKDNQSAMQHSLLRSEAKSHIVSDFDYAADYAMIDNEAIYASLINNNE